jgi:hypothetical protein
VHALSGVPAHAAEDLRALGRTLAG